MLTPYLLQEFDGSFVGWTPETFLSCPALGLTGEDTLGVKESDAGTASSATDSTLVDSTKSWTNDAFIGKAVILKTGTGAGQIRKITDNDGTSITVSPNWTANPDATSTYTIVDEAYRFFLLYSGGMTNIALREGLA